MRSRLKQRLLAVVIAWMLMMTVVVAQSVQIAPIIIDGRSVFNVSGSGTFTAKQRAEEANRLLKEAIKNPQPPLQVEIDTNRESPIIMIDGAYLLSVTSNDALGARSVTEQAQIWKEQLEQAIKTAQYERTKSYLLRAGLMALVVLIIAFFVNRRLDKFWHNGVRRLFVKPAAQDPAPVTEIPSYHSQIHTQIPTHPPKPTLELVSDVLLMGLKGIIWLMALIYISGSFPQTRQLSYDFVWILGNSLVTDVFSLGSSSYSFLDILLLIVVLIMVVFASRTIGTVLRSRFLSFTGLSRAAQETIAVITNYSLLFLGVIIILQIWGLDISSLTVFAGVLGVGIGLGIQGIAKEFVSGLVLIFERPIQVGDFVEVGHLMGTVERISVRSTEIRTLDQVSIILPNSRFLESEVINWTHRSPVSRLKLPVGVAYGSDLSLVKNALLDAAREHKEVLTNPSPRVFFIGFGDSALNFQLLVWIAKPYKQFQIKSDLYFIIDSVFRKRGIEIPFPQQDLHIRSGDLPINAELLQGMTELSKSLANWLQQQSK